jgi:uncharacterized integral membrane protein
MWIFRWLLTLVVMIYAVLFAAMNLDLITIRLPYPVNQEFQLEKAVVVLGGIAIGILLWALISFFSGLEGRGRLRDAERKHQAIKEELTRLRNLSLMDDHELFGQDASTPPAEPASKAVPTRPCDALMVPGDENKSDSDLVEIASKEKE